MVRELGFWGGDRGVASPRSGYFLPTGISLAVLIRVVLGEDSYIVREGVPRLLAAADGIHVEAACEDRDSRSARSRIVGLTSS